MSIVEKWFNVYNNNNNNNNNSACILPIMLFWSEQLGWIKAQLPSPDELPYPACGTDRSSNVGNTGYDFF